MATTIATFATFNSTAGVKTNANMTPSANEITLVVVANTGGGSTVPTVSDNHPDGLGTYTEISGGFSVTASDFMWVFIRGGLFGSGGHVTTLTMDPIAGATLAAGS